MPDNTRVSELVKLALAREFKHIADMTDGDIAIFPEQQRFRAIKSITDRVINLSPAPKNDPRQPVCEETFATEIASLVRISETMRHTTAYMNWLDACRNLLIYKLFNDNTYMRFTKGWDSKPLELKKGSHRARERLHTQAANQTFKPIFKTTRLEFPSHARREDIRPERRTILQGLSVGNINTGKHRIELNTHADSSFSDAARSNNFGHHEKVHNLGFQLGLQFSAGNFSLLAEQYYDGMLWYHLKKEQAIIPGRIKPGYRAQFHEVVAFAEGDKMESLITEILQPGFSIQKPNLELVA